VKVDSEGHVTPYPSVGALADEGSLIRLPRNRTQVVVVKAGARACVAGGTDLVNPDQHRVTVTVERDSPDVLGMTGRVALAPVLATAARPERHPPGRQRAMQRLVVHPADHEHLATVVLLHHGTHEAIDVTLQTLGNISGKGGLRGYRGHPDILPCQPPGKRSRGASVGCRGATN
jgi:hypothetical protein